MKERLGYEAMCYQMGTNCSPIDKFHDGSKCTGVYCGTMQFEWACFIMEDA